MLRFLFNNLEIDFEGTVSHRMLNPLFNNEVSHTYNCKTVLTARTKDVINQLHLPEVGYSNVRFHATLITDAFTFTGRAYLNSITDKYLDFQFNAQNDFWNKAGTDLRSLVTTFDAQYFPMRNQAFMNEFPFYGAGYSGWVNAMEDSIFNLGAIQKNNKTSAPLPSLKLNTVIRDIFNNLGFAVVKDSITEHADLNQLYLFNSNANGTYVYNRGEATPGLNKITVTDYAYEFRNEGIPDHHGVIQPPEPHNIPDGCYVLVWLSLTNPSAPVSHKYNAIKAQIHNKVFKAIVTSDTSLTFDLRAPVESFDPSVDQASSVNTSLFTPHYSGKTEVASNHVPNVSATEFLKEVEKLAGCKIFPDESAKEVRIFLIKDILNSNDTIDITGISSQITEQALDHKDGYNFSFEDPAEDEFWSTRIKEIGDQMTVKASVATKNDLPMDGQHNDIRLVLDENAWYLYQNVYFLRNQGWAFYCDNNMPLKSRQGELAISTKFSPVLTELIEILGTDNEPLSKNMYLHPEVPGKLLLLNQSATDEFRVFFYRGLVNTQVWVSDHYFTVQMPLCTIDVYDHTGAKIPAANLALRWDSEYGLYNQLYKDYIDLLINKYREATVFINWPGHMLNSFAWWKKYRIQHQNYLVKSIDLEITKQGTTLKNSVLVPV